MITEEELGKALRNWNPEKDSVRIMKDELDNYGDEIWGIGDDNLLNAILNMFWAGKYVKYHDTKFAADNNIFSIDYDGNCLLLNDEINDVKHISELQRDAEDEE